VKRCLSCDHLHADRGWRCPACGFQPEIRNDIPCFAPTLDDIDDNFDVASFRSLAEAEEKSFWFPPRNSLIVWALRTYFPHTNSLFELGCGTGIVTNAISESNRNIRLVGADIHSAGLAEAAKRIGGRATLAQMSGLAIPFADEFDVAVAFDVIEHIDDDVGALKQMRNAVRPGGGIMLIVPRHKFMWSEVDDLAKHRRRYAGAEFKNLIAAAGLSLERMFTFGAWTFPFQVASRLCPRKNAHTLTEALELNLPGSVQSLLKWMLDMERRTIAQGMNYPFGASLFAVARRPQ